MPRTIEMIVYSFDELNTTAKEKALSEVRIDYADFGEFVLDDVVTAADLLGINIKQRSVKLYGGGYDSEPEIYFSVSGCQGDGACFDGNYQYKKGSVKAIKEYAPTDKELNRIAEALAAEQRRNFYRLTAETECNSYYSNSANMRVHCDDSQEIRQLMRDFADWIYAQLVAEYEYRTSEEQLTEMINANGYEFYANGDRI